MNKQPMFFESTYAADYTVPIENREMALNRQSDPAIGASCFSPPMTCTTPTKPHPEQFPPCDPPPPITECGSNRFLANVCNTYPAVYEDLQQYTAWADEASQPRLKSLYQVDYNPLPEHKLGPYPEDTKYYIRECNGTACTGLCSCAGGLCSCQLCPPGGTSACQGQYPDRCVERPSKIPKPYISMSHWPERPYQDEKKMTEYRDRIGRMGRLTQRERIHDHQGCASPDLCQHKFFLRK